MIRLPEAYVRQVEQVHGEHGRSWLAGLPALIEDLSGRWHLQVGAPAGELSYNLVMYALQGDRPVILKLGVPDRELASEAAALGLFDGRGAAKILESDLALGALLLERILPGTPLWEEADDQTAPVVAGVMQRLWRTPPKGHPFRSIDDWAMGFDRLRARYSGSTGPLPAAGIERAEKTLADRDPRRDVVLHGDLHHGNVLHATREPYLAIDPKGVIGAREFEVGAYLRNPLSGVLGSPDPASRLRRRIEMLSELLDIPADTLCDWAFAQAMLSAWWTIEDHGSGADRTLRYAGYLEGLSFG